MAQSQRFQILDNKSQELSVLAEYLKNPNLVQELAEEIKFLNALTKDEELKASEGRDLIKNREIILKEIQDKKDELYKLQSVNDTALSDIAEKTKSLGNAQSELAAKEKGRSDAENYLAKAKADFEVEKKNHASNVQAHSDKVNSDLEKIKAHQDANYAEANRLDDMDKSLKEKASKIKAMVGE